MVHKRIKLILLIGILFITISGILADPYLEVQDSTVYYPENNTCIAEKSGLEIIVTNCRARDIDIQDITQEISFTWNGGQDKEVDWLFAYDGELADFEIYLLLNGTEDTWLDKTHLVNYIGEDKLGRGWQYYKVINETMKSGRTYTSRWIFTPVNKTIQGKWRIFGKLSDESISEAVAGDRYIFVDPWWDDICGNFDCNTTAWHSLNNNWTVYNASGKAVFRSTAYPAYDYITQDVGLPATKNEYWIELNVYRTWFNWTEFWIELGGVESERFTSEGTHGFYLTINESGNLTIHANRTYSESINAYVVLDNITITSTNKSLQVFYDDETKEDGYLEDYSDEIYVNVTLFGTTELFENITYRLFNSSMNLINESFFPSEVLDINWTDISDGTYYYNVTVSNTEGNLSSTETRSITVETGPNITLCRTLYDNNVYYLSQDIETNNTACILLYGENITLYGNSHKITGGGGIYAFADNSSIYNTNLTHFQVDGTFNNIENMTLQDCTAEECFLIGYYNNNNNNNIRNLYINNASDKAVRMWGIAFGGGEGASHNIFQDCLFENITGNDIVLESFLGFGTNLNNTFLNCTYESENVGTQSSLYRKWYYQAYVNDSEGNDVDNANVTAFDSDGDYEFNLTTGADGLTGTAEITEYLNYYGAKIYSTPHMIYVEDDLGHQDSHSYNVTAVQNNLDYFTLSCWMIKSFGLEIPRGCVYELENGGVQEL